MAAMDVFVLPTYREGLGNVLLEAAAVGLPTITTDATGARDAIVAGRTGLQVPTGDPKALATALATLVRDPSLRSEMGRAGRAWVCEHFDQTEVWRRQAQEYRALAAGPSTRRTG
jgi:glycosyltransferase involved in cell wall biosynthesis